MAPDSCSVYDKMNDQCISFDTWTIPHAIPSCILMIAVMNYGNKTTFSEAIIFAAYLRIWQLGGLLCRRALGRRLTVVCVHTKTKPSPRINVRYYSVPAGWIEKQSRTTGSRGLAPIDRLSIGPRAQIDVYLA